MATLALDRGDTGAAEEYAAALTEPDVGQDFTPLLLPFREHDCDSYSAVLIRDSRCQSLLLGRCIASIGQDDARSGYWRAVVVAVANQKLGCEGKVLSCRPEFDIATYEADHGVLLMTESSGNVRPGPDPGIVE